MKKLKFVLLYCAFSTVGFVACTKDDSATTPSITSTSSGSIKTGTAAAFIMKNVTGTVTWSVTPSSTAYITATQNQASVLFSKAGSYVVKGTASSVEATKVVNVVDSLPTDSLPTGGGGNGSPNNPVALTGDKINIVLSKIDSSGLGSGLTLYAKTNNNYGCLESYLMGQLQVSNTGDYSITFSGVNVPTGTYCTGGQIQAVWAKSIFPIANGAHAITVTLNGVAYTGSFTKTGSSYVFTWPANGNVTLSPTSL